MFNKPSYTYIFQLALNIILWFQFGHQFSWIKWKSASSIDIFMANNMLTNIETQWTIKFNSQKIVFNDLW